MFEKDGSDVKGIAKYGEDHKKKWEIHTQDHKELGAHIHYWKDGHPDGDPLSLPTDKLDLLNKIRDFEL